MKLKTIAFILVLSTMPVWAMDEFTEVVEVSPAADQPQMPAAVTEETTALAPVQEPMVPGMPEEQPVTPPTEPVQEGVTPQPMELQPIQPTETAPVELEVKPLHPIDPMRPVEVEAAIAVGEPSPATPEPTTPVIVLQEVPPVQKPVEVKKVEEEKPCLGAEQLPQGLTLIQQIEWLIDDGCMSSLDKAEQLARDKSLSVPIRNKYRQVIINKRKKLRKGASAIPAKSQSPARRSGVRKYS